MMGRSKYVSYLVSTATLSQSCIVALSLLRGKQATCPPQIAPNLVSALLHTVNHKSRAVAAAETPDAVLTKISAA